jgi:beta-ketodecanoyl-[acyl-carrier-protein] synthase
VHNVVISGTGLYTPAHSISNEELVESFNTWSQQFNPTTPRPSSAAKSRQRRVRCRLHRKGLGHQEPLRDGQGRHPRPAAHEAAPGRAQQRRTSVLCEMAVAAAARRWSAPAAPPPMSTA